MSKRVVAKSGTEPVLSFARATEWRDWLASHHATSSGVLLRIPKKGGSRAITYAEAVEVALAWGWIDSQKRALDATAWLQRFTPRTAKSPWSKINRAKAEAMIAAGSMHAPGLAEVERARRDGRWERAYDGARSSTLPADLAAAMDETRARERSSKRSTARTATRSFIASRRRQNRRPASNASRASSPCARAARRFTRRGRRAENANSVVRR